MDDLKARLGNAQLKRIKHEAGIASEPRQRDAAAVKLPEGERVVPPRDRKREQVVVQEINACLTGKEKIELATALKEGRQPSKELTAKVAELPSSKQYAKQEKAHRASLKERIAMGIARVGAALSSAFDQANGNRKGDAGDDAGRMAIRLGSRAARAVASQIVRAAKAPKPPEAPAAAQELKQSIKMKR